MWFYSLSTQEEGVGKKVFGIFSHPPNNIKNNKQDYNRVLICLYYGSHKWEMNLKWFWKLSDLSSYHEDLV